MPGEIIWTLHNLEDIRYFLARSFGAVGNISDMRICRLPLMYLFVCFIVSKYLLIMQKNISGLPNLT